MSNAGPGVWHEPGLAPGFLPHGCSVLLITRFGSLELILSPGVRLRLIVVGVGPPPSPVQPGEVEEGATPPWEHTWPASAPVVSPAHINENFTARSRAGPDQEIAKSRTPYLSPTAHSLLL